MDLKILHALHVLKLTDLLIDQLLLNNLIIITQILIVLNIF